MISNIIKRTPELSKVEERILSKLNSDAALLEEIPAYLLKLGGKRVRPLLLLISYRALGGEPGSDQLIDLAAGLELVHMSTLLHDDIIDHSSLRRHHESPLSKFGLANTLLAGDFLLVKAFGICAGLDSFLVKATEYACIELTEGEILETSLNQERHNIESGLTIARKKTASLFKLAALSSAYLSKAGSDCQVSMADFGLNLGIAFQILDDILDVTASRDSFGKIPGTDIRERKPSIVNLLWLETGSSLSKQLLTKPNPQQAPFVEASLSEIRNSSILDKARDYALQYANQAKTSLEKATSECQNPVNPKSFEDLMKIVNYIVERAV